MGIDLKGRIRRIATELLETTPGQRLGIRGQEISLRYFQDFGVSLGHDAGLGPRAAILGIRVLVQLLRGCAEFVVDEDSGGDDQVRVRWSAKEKVVRLVRQMCARKVAEGHDPREGVMIPTVAWEFKETFGEGFKKCLQREQRGIRGGDVETLSLFLQACPELLVNGYEITTATVRPRGEGAVGWLAQYVASLRASVAAAAKGEEGSKVWELLAKKYPPGSTMRGRVSWVGRKLATVEAEDGAVGMLGFGEVTGAKGAEERLDGYLLVGALVETVVLGISTEKRRITLSLKRTPEGVAAWKMVAGRYPAGRRLRGTVSSVTPTGAYVELERGGAGFIANQELSWTDREVKAEGLLKVGQEIAVVVLGTNDARQVVNVGVRELTPDPWEELIAKYPIGAVLQLPISEVTHQGAFFMLEGALDGYVSREELTWKEKHAKAGKLFKVGDEVEAVVIGYDHAARQVLMSTRLATPDPWDTAPEKYPPGTRLQAKVHQATGFGVFVELEPGVNGLVNKKSIAGAVITSPLGDYFEKGQAIDVEVVSVERATKRMGLMLRGEDEKGLVGRPMLPKAIKRREKWAKKRAAKLAKLAAEGKLPTEGKKKEKDGA